MPPLKPQVGEQLLNGRLPVQYFDIRGAVFEPGHFHGIKNIRRSGQDPLKHTAARDFGRKAASGFPEPCLHQPANKVHGPFRVGTPGFHTQHGALARGERH